MSLASFLTGLTASAGLLCPPGRCVRSPLVGAGSSPIPTSPGGGCDCVLAAPLARSCSNTVSPGPSPPYGFISPTDLGAAPAEGVWYEPHIAHLLIRATRQCASRSMRRPLLHLSQQKAFSPRCQHACTVHSLSSMRTHRSMHAQSYGLDGQRTHSLRWSSVWKTGGAPPAAASGWRWRFGLWSPP